MIKVKSFFSSWKMLIGVIAVAFLVIAVCFVDFSKEAPTQPKSEKQLRAELLETYKKGNQSAKKPVATKNRKEVSAVDRNAAKVIETKTANRQVTQINTSRSNVRKVSTERVPKVLSASDIEQLAQDKDIKIEDLSQDGSPVIKITFSNKATDEEGKQTSNKIKYPSTLAEVMQAKSEASIKRKEAAAKAEEEASYQRVRDLLAQKVGLPPISPVTANAARKDQRGVTKPGTTRPGARIKYGNSTPMPRYSYLSAPGTARTSSRKRSGLSLTSPNQKSIRVNAIQNKNSALQMSAINGNTATAAKLISAKPVITGVQFKAEKADTAQTPAKTSDKEKK